MSGVREAFGLNVDTNAEFEDDSTQNNSEQFEIPNITHERLRELYEEGSSMLNEMNDTQVCMCCDWIKFKSEGIIINLRKKPDPKLNWKLLSYCKDWGIPKNLRNYYCLNRIGCQIHRLYSTLMLSKNSLHQPECVCLPSKDTHAFLCHQCKKCLTNNKMPKYAISNALWIGSKSEIPVLHTCNEMVQRVMAFGTNRMKCVRAKPVFYFKENREHKGKHILQRVKFQRHAVTVDLNLDDLTHNVN